jgi:hypothetical protein
LLIKKQLKTFLYSIVLIPVGATDSFLNLKYSKGTPNKVTFGKSVTIAVNKSASPLFYKMSEVKKVKRIKVSGEVQITKSIDNQQDDAYFQMGIIYEGNYRPNRFVKMFLPEWLKQVLGLNDDFGVGVIEFHEVSTKGKLLSKTESIRDINLSFKTATTLNEKNEFNLDITLKDKKVLGFWLRADGDDSGAIFKTQLNSFLMEI